MTKNKKKYKLNKSHRGDSSQQARPAKQRTVPVPRDVALLKRCITAVLCLIIFYVPYVRGLYFEREQLFAEILVFILMALFSLYKALKRDKSFLSTPLDYVLLGFVLVYALSITVAVSKRDAIAEWLKYCMYFSVFYMVSYLAKEEKIKKLFMWTAALSALGVALIGLDSMASSALVNALNEVFRSLGAKKDVFFGLFEGGRLSSTLQYANALAAYLLGIYFLTTALFIVSKKRYLKILSLFSGTVLFAAFLNTWSRGAFIVGGIVLLLQYVLIKVNRKEILFYNIATIATGAVLGIIFARSSQSLKNSLSLYILLLVSAALFLALHWLYGKIIDKVSNRLKENRKVIKKIAITAATFIILLSTAGLIILSQTQPVDLKCTDKDKYDVFTREIKLKPGEYTLVYNIKGLNTNEKRYYTYKLLVWSENLQNILKGEESTRLVTYYEYAKNIDEIKKISFTIPEDSKRVYIQFGTFYKNTEALMNNISINNAKTGKLIKKIKLENKYGLDKLINRFSHPFRSNSFFRRIYYYKDGLKLFKDNNKLLGNGGGAWKYLYQQYQLYLYFSSLPHNYPMQVLVETGIFGIAVYAVLLLVLVWMYLVLKKERSIYSVCILVSILFNLLHSWIDFDLSLSAVIIVLFSMLGLVNSLLPEKEGYKLFKIKVKKTVLTPAAVAIIAVLIAVLPIRYTKAYAKLDRASIELSKKNAAVALQLIDKARRLDPRRLAITTDYVNLYIRSHKQISKQQKDEMLKILDNLKEKAAKDSSILGKIAALYYNLAEYEGAEKTIEKTILLRPFDPKAWEQVSQIYMHTMTQYFNRRESKKALKTMDKALDLMNYASEINKKNFVPFIFTPETQQTIERIKYIKDNLEEKAKKINLSNIMFYSIPQMDVDNNGIPDQWTIYERDNTLNVFEKDGTLNVTAEKYDGRSFIYTRQLFLKEGQTYNLEMRINGKSKLDKIRYYIPGVLKRIETIKQQNNIFNAEFTVPKTEKEKKYRLRLYIDKPLEGIEKVIIRRER